MWLDYGLTQGRPALKTTTKGTPMYCPRPSAAALLLISWMVIIPAARAAEVTQTVPQDMHVYLALKEPLSGERNQAQVGQLVKCAVWRDVIVGGTTLVPAGTP